MYIYIYIYIEWDVCVRYISRIIPFYFFCQDLIYNINILVCFMILSVLQPL